MRRLEWANALRGLAALSVIGYHFAVAFWIHQDASAGLARRGSLYAGDSAAPGFARALIRLPIDFNALGVGFFFLLSGYVIAISLDRYSRRGFLIGRCMRILPTYAAGYLVTCSIIWAVSDPRHELSVGSVLLGSVPGLHFLIGTTAPDDGIVWTLIIELVFYVICLATYRTLTRRWQVITGVAAACAAIQLLLDVAPLGSPQAGLRYVVLLACPFIPVMLVGVVLSGCARGKLSRLSAALLVLLLTATHLTLASTTNVVPTSLKYRLTFVATIATFTAIWAVGKRWHRHALTDFFADISYPLYVVHPVLGYALLSIMTVHAVPAPVAVLAAAGTAITAAWLLHTLVEAPTHRVGQRWARSIAYSPETEPMTTRA